MTHESASKSSETSSGTEYDEGSKNTFPPVTKLNAAFGIPFYASFFRSGKVLHVFFTRRVDVRHLDVISALVKAISNCVKL